MSFNRVSNDTTLGELPFARQGAPAVSNRGTDPPFLRRRPSSVTPTGPTWPAPLLKQTTWRLKGCPRISPTGERCQGDMYRDHNGRRSFWHCLQCGYSADLERHKVLKIRDSRIVVAERGI